MNEIRKLRVFLCHASQDKTIVYDLYERLLVEGWIDPWLDKEKLLPGTVWHTEIEEAVVSADAVIVFLSNNSVSKEGVFQKEVRLALDKAEEKPDDVIFIIPLRIEDVNVPGRLRRYHYQDYFDSLEEAYHRLLASLEKRAKTLKIDVVIQVAAEEIIDQDDFDYEEYQHNDLTKLLSRRKNNDLMEEDSRFYNVIEAMEIIFLGFSRLGTEVSFWGNKVNTLENREKLVNVIVGFLKEIFSASGKTVVWVASNYVVASFIVMILSLFGHTTFKIGETGWIPFAYIGLAILILKVAQSVYLDRFLGRGEKAIYVSVALYVCQVLIVNIDTVTTVLNSSETSRLSLVILWSLVIIGSFLALYLLLTFFAAVFSGGWIVLIALILYFYWSNIDLYALAIAVIYNPFWIIVANEVSLAIYIFAFDD